MSVRFIIGRAGTGKSRRCFDEIVRMLRDAPLGPSIYWLLPKQATFTAERLLTCGSGLPAFARARVVSFQELGREILSECGGIAIPEVTATGRQMILGHLLRKHREQLGYFKSVSHQAGLALELDATFAEFERNGKTADDFEKLLNDKQDAAPLDDPLNAKLRDLLLLYRAYSQYLGQERLDPHRRLLAVLECIERSKSLRGASVFVDSFYEFTDYERKFLAAVAKSASRVEIALTLDPNSAVLRDPQAASDELSIFHPIEDTYRRLHAALVDHDVEIEEPLILQRTQRFASDSISHVEACLFARRAQASDAPGPRMIEAPDRRAEVDAAAREVQRLLESQLRLRDIAVLVRDLDAYHELIDASFREHGLPYFVDRRRSATHHPLIQFTRALQSAAQHEFDHDAVITLLKSGLVTLGADDATTRDCVDELENYVLCHRIRGRAWAQDEPWTFHRKLLRDAQADESAESDGAAPVPAEPNMADPSAHIDGLRRRLIAPLLPFMKQIGQAIDRPVALRQIVGALLNVFEALSIRTTLSRWIEQDMRRKRLDHQAEHPRVWNELCALLDQMADLLGDEMVSARDFVEILESALATFDLALTPPTVDQILVGSVDRTRTPPMLKAVIVLGLNEGSFPYCPKENSIFGDSERRELSRRRIEIGPETNRRLFDERFLAYTAFTRASDHLCVLRPQADDAGRPMAPSAFWSQLREIFRTVMPIVLPRDAQRSADCIGTPRQLITSLLRWARDESKGAIWDALYARLAQHECTDNCDDPIDIMCFRAWRALAYDNEATLSPQIANQLFGSPLSASVSRIESFANCPFKHFATYGLGLQPREEEDVTSMDLGVVYHGILEQLVREMVRRREDFASVSKQFTDEQIRLHAQRIGQELRHEVLLSTARNQYILRHVQKTLDQVVASQREAARFGKFKPWKAELVFGLQPNDPTDRAIPALELKTPAGHSVKLRGKIDRVDLIEEQSVFAVIDYKLRGQALKFDSLYHGLSLQLLTYLLVLQSPVARKQLKQPGLTPAAAFYVRLLRRMEAVKHPDDAIPPDESEFHLKEKPRGIIDRRYLHSLDGGLTQGASKVVQAFIKKDGGLGASSDAVETESFAALLRFVQDKIIKLADQIIAGNIGIAPYRMGTATPCPNCNFRSICRFDPARQPYRRLDSKSKADVIAEAMQPGGAT